MIYFQVSRNCPLHKWIAPHEKFVDRKLGENAYDPLHKWIAPHQKFVDRKLAENAYDQLG